MEAVIISERLEAKRSSILTYSDKNPPPTIKEDSLDWLHVAYLDDLDHPDILSHIKSEFSVDFCKAAPRENHLSVMEKSSLVFDSRERKGLYSDIIIETPIILHDPSGCECIINGKVTQEEFITPQKNLNVNGAGDVFAGIFLNKLYNSSTSKAIKFTPRATTDHLRQKNEI